MGRSSMTSGRGVCAYPRHLLWTRVSVLPMEQSCALITGANTLAARESSVHRRFLATPRPQRCRGVVDCASVALALSCGNSSFVANLGSRQVTSVVFGHPCPSCSGCPTVMAFALHLPSLRMPVRSADPRQISGWSEVSSGDKWDIFGYPCSFWGREHDAAWDCFGFTVRTRHREHAGVAVLVQQVVDGQRSAALAQVPVTHLDELYPGNWHPFVLVRTDPGLQLLCGFGCEFVASVRGAKHWVSRWRRGMRAMRKLHASMVLTHALPGMHEVVRLVHSPFLRGGRACSPRRTEGSPNVLHGLPCPGPPKNTQRSWRTSPCTWHLPPCVALL